MPDMLVPLRKLPEYDPIFDALQAQNIRIIRALAPDMLRVCTWVKEHGGPYGAGECAVSMAKTPTTCFLAVVDKEIIGYACYNAIAPDFFGPTMVLEDYRGKGIGKALLLKCLYALKAEGYVYGIIGGVGPAEFYAKCVGATIIEDSTPGIYEDFLLG